MFTYLPMSRSQHFRAHRGHAGQPGPPAENREWGQVDARRQLAIRATQPAGANMMADTTLSDGVTLSDGTSALASITLPEGGGRRTEDGGKTDPRFLPPSLLRPPPFWPDGITLLGGLGA